MERTDVLKVFQSLSAKLRLDLFCRLVHSGTQGMVAGSLAEEFGIPATNLSFHLKALLAAGLVTVEPEGRYQRYRANVPHMLRVLAFIAENCAQGEGPAKCVPARPVRKRAAARARPAA
jgi:ArsR family transcriptional regulator, arsenate/arsenite/antimonite-responsive transcriptional repressor